MYAFGAATARLKASAAVPFAAGQHEPYKARHPLMGEGPPPARIPPVSAGVGVGGVYGEGGWMTRAGWHECKAVSGAR